MSPEIAHAIGLFFQGIDLPEAVRRAYRLEKSAGRAYSEARSAVEAALRSRA